MRVGPIHQKPEKPGVFEGAEDTVHILYVAGPDAGFEQAAMEAFSLIKEAQQRFPDRRRVFYLEIEGHEGTSSGFDPDFFEFQQEFLQGFLGPFLSGLDMPLQSLFNPNPQRNDLPDKIDFGPPQNPGPLSFHLPQ